MKRCRVLAMEPFSPEKNLETPFVSDNKKTVATLADLRRKTTELRSALLALPRDEKDEKQKVAIESANKEASGERVIEKETALRELSEKEFILKEQAELFAETAPGHAAYLIGRIAKLKQCAGLSFEEDYERASALNASAGAPRKPDDLFPSAELLGIARRKAQALHPPSADKLANLYMKGEAALQDIALVLPEKEREAFLASVPEEERQAAARTIDRALSPVLKEKTVESAEETEQGMNVKERAKKSIMEIFAEPHEKLAPVIKVLTETISELDSEDGKRLLAALGAEGLKSEKEEHGGKAKISAVARIVKTLADIDIQKGGMLAMKFLAKSDVPPRLFSFFTEKLTQSGYLTSKLERYQDRKYIPFLRRLIATAPGQFNTVIDTLAQIKDFEPSEHPDDVFAALEDLDSLTPIIFNRYRLADAAGKKELAAKIREMRPKFFRNLPIKDILHKKDSDILAEMVYLAYRPVNMSFERVQALMRSLEDRTEDLADYNFPEQGYDFSLKSSGEIALKKGEIVDTQKLKGYKRLFCGIYPENEDQMKHLADLLVRLAKAGNFNEEETASLLSFMSRDEVVQNFLAAFTDISEKNIYDYLAEAKELSEIYFKDNYAGRLNNFLSANPTIEGRLMKVLSNPERQEVFRRKFGKEASGIDWKNLTDRKEISKLLALFLGATALKPVREDIGRAMKKFAPVSGGEAKESVANLKAYISKNIGSFFAKASAGICTAEDVSLFNGENHFHVNVIENDTRVCANIQAYIVGMGNKKALVLRGFNPSTSFMKRIDPGLFCEKVLEIGRQFIKDNHLSGLYITEQGSWHALSNREKIPDYLAKKYHTTERRMSYALRVASAHTIANIYRI